MPSASSPDGSLYLTFASNGTLRFWDLSDGRLRLTTRERYWPRGLSVPFSVDNQLLAIQSRRENPVGVVECEDVAILSALDGQLLQSFPTRKSTAANFHPDGRTFEVLQLHGETPGQPSAFSGWTLRTWDILTWAELPAPSLPHPIPNFLASSLVVRRIAYLDGNRNDLRLADIDGLLPTITLHVPNTHAKVDHAAFSQDGRRIALGRPGPTVEVWDIPTQRLLARHQVRDPSFNLTALHLPGRGETFHAILDQPVPSWSSGYLIEPRLLLGMAPRCELVIWDLDQPRAARTRLREPDLECLSPDGTLAASRPRDPRGLRILNLRPAP